MDSEAIFFSLQNTNETPNTNKTPQQKSMAEIKYLNDQLSGNKIFEWPT